MDQSFKEWLIPTNSNFHRKLTDQKQIPVSLFVIATLTSISLFHFNLYMCYFMLQVKPFNGEKMSLVVQTICAMGIGFSVGLMFSWKAAIAVIVVQLVIIVCFYKRDVLKNMMKVHDDWKQWESSQTYLKFGNKL